MNRSTLIATIVALVLLLAWWIWPALRPSPAPPPDWPDTAPIRPASTMRTGDWTGTASCSGRGCHGSIDSRLDPKTTPILQGEFGKWLAHDSHAKAYEVLFNPQSRQIARHLGIPEAHTDARCLACHVQPDNSVADRVFGVGCEACHGSAVKWIDPHTTKAWKNKSIDEKLQLGMRPVQDVTITAQTCVRCHVGAPPAAADGVPRDVNHDLIAAGHPRLNFEFGSFLANLPPHWNTKFAERKPRDEIRAWGVGQVVSAQAALDLLTFRAEPKHENPWPEFAEYDCFACHHRLDAVSWRQQRSPSTQGNGRRLGALPWGTWYFSAPLRLLDKNDPNETKVADMITALRRAMERPLPANLVAQARAASAQMGTLLRRMQSKFDAAHLRGFLQQPWSEFDKSWDAAEQRFLAACALYALQPDPALRQALRDFRERWGRPEVFHPERFQQEISRLVKE